MRAVLALLFLATSTAHAGNNELTLGTFDRALRSPSANAVTGDSLVGGQLAYARVLPLGLAPGLELWATASMSWAGADGELFQTMSTELDMVGFGGGGRAVYALHPRILLAGRIEVGTARTGLTLRAGGHTVSDARWAGTATAATGLELLALALPRFSLGIRFELGYVAATAPALSPREDGDSTTIELDAMQASIGHLDLGGRFFMASMLSRF